MQDSRSLDFEYCSSAGCAKSPGGARLAPPPPQSRVACGQRGYVGEEQIGANADDDEIAKQEQAPSEIVADDLAFVTHEAAGGNADAGGLRRDRLADLGAHRVERRQEQQREPEHL